MKRSYNKIKKMIEEELSPEDRANLLNLEMCDRCKHLQREHNLYGCLHRECVNAPCTIEVYD